MSLVSDAKKVITNFDVEKGLSKNDFTQAQQNKSTSSKLPYYVLGGLTVLSMTSVALYAIYGGDDNDEKNGQVAQGGSVVEGITLFGGGLLALGQAFATNGAARTRMYSPSTQNELTRMENTVQYLESYTPPFEVNDEDDDVESIASDDAESITSDGDYVDALDISENEQQKTNAIPQQRRGAPDSDRDLMFPITGEYLLQDLADDSYYDSVALNNGNIAYVFSSGNPLITLDILMIKDQAGNNLYNHSLPSLKNPSITTYSGDIVINYEATYGKINALVFSDTGKQLNQASLFTIIGAVSIGSPVAHEVPGGNLFSAVEYYSSSGYQVTCKAFDAGYSPVNSGASFVPGSSAYSYSLALGSFSDRSAVLFYETGTAVAGKYYDPNGVIIGNSVNLGACNIPKSVNIANDLVFVSCINPPKLQGQGINQSGQKVIAPFTIFDGPIEGKNKYDLAASQDGTRIISHYSNGTNSYFKIFDENGKQLGRPIQSNIDSNVYNPVATIAPNGNFVASFIQIGSRNFPYGRTFKENSPPALVMSLVPPNATVEQFFSYTIPPGAWVDADGHALTFSGELANGGNLNSTWIHFSNNTFYGTPPQGSQGTWNVADVADDGYLFGDVSAPFKINVNSGSPILGPLPSADLTINQHYYVQLEASSPDGDPYTFSSNNLPFGASLSGSGLFNWDAKSGEQGVHGISIVVSNNYGKSDSGIMSLKVLNRAPVPSSMPHRKFEAGTSLSFDASIFFSDPDGDPITFTATEYGQKFLPSWAEFTNEGDLTGTPQKQDKGAFRVDFTASDPYEGTASEVGEFEIVATKAISTTMYAVIGLAIGAFFSCAGFVYKVKQQKIDAWADRVIKPYYLSATKKADTCMSFMLSCKRNMTSSNNIPLLSATDADVNAETEKETA